MDGIFNLEEDNKMAKIIGKNDFGKFKNIIDNSPVSLIISLSDKEFFQKLKLWLHFAELEYDEELYPNIFTKDYFFDNDSKTTELVNEVSKRTETFKLNDLVLFVDINENYLVTNCNYYNSDQLIAIPIDKNEFKIKLVKKTSKSK